MFPLNTVRVYKTKELGREEMRFGQSVQSNLWFDIGSPWLSVSWKEGLSVSPRCTPCCFNEFAQAFGIEKNALVYVDRKQVAAKFTSSCCFLGKPNRPGSCAIWLPFFKLELKPLVRSPALCLLSYDSYRVLSSASEFYVIF